MVSGLLENIKKKNINNYLYVLILTWDSLNGSKKNIQTDVTKPNQDINTIVRYLLPLLRHLSSVFTLNHNKLRYSGIEGTEM